MWCTGFIVSVRGDESGEKLVGTLGITRLSKSQVSIMAKDLDAQIEAFRTRPLERLPSSPRTR